MVLKKDLVKKWEGAEGRMSLKDIKDPYLKENMAQLLENQECKDFSGREVFTMNEASDGAINLGQLGADGMSNGVSNADAYKFRPVALALVRRTFPDLFANKIVGVQAMSTPVGLAYALRVVYNDGSLTEAAWDKVPEYAGYSGSTVGTSAALTNGQTTATGAVTSAAEGWQIAGTGGTPEWPQLKLKIDQKAIEAVTRKLAASFSLEAAQDIRAMQGIDIEREMVNILQYEITAELDREILANVRNAAVDTANGGEVIPTIDLTGNGTGIDGRWAGEKYMNIIASIVYFANKIGTTTRRAPANFVVVSPAIASALQAAGHQFVQYSQNVNPTTSMAAIGKLNGTLEVYRDQYATTDYALLGLKGSGVSDAGIIFCPYIMGLTNRAISQDDFSPRIGVMSRYSLVTNMLGAGRYYRMLTFANTNKLIAGAQ